jgi:hypothetical protein
MTPRTPGNVTVTPADGYQVAVTVFVTVARGQARDQHDAQNWAVGAVEQALRSKARDWAADVLLVPAQYPAMAVRWVNVHAVMETGAAGTNGYLTITPTGQAYPHATESD